jgi:hypothetical protein
MLLDFTKEVEFNRVCWGFRNLDQFGELHIIVSDGNVEDYWIDIITFKDNLSEEERSFLKDLKSLPESMRYFAYDYASDE